MQQTRIPTQGSTRTRAGRAVAHPKPALALSSAREIASYYLLRSVDDGDLISPLKMQKLVYYAYVWVLAVKHQHLFAEAIQAWPNGPVVPSLYTDLKHYGASPIGAEFVEEAEGNGYESFARRFDPSIRELLDEVYETYMPLSAFELVTLSHSELPWTNARTGLDPVAASQNVLADDDILIQYIPSKENE